MLNQLKNELVYVTVNSIGLAQGSLKLQTLLVELQKIKNPVYAKISNWVNEIVTGTSKDILGLIGLVDAVILATSTVTKEEIIKPVPVVEYEGISYAEKINYRQLQTIAHNLKTYSYSGNIDIFDDFRGYTDYRLFNKLLKRMQIPVGNHYIREYITRYEQFIEIINKLDFMPLMKQHYLSKIEQNSLKDKDIYLAFKILQDDELVFNAVSHLLKSNENIRLTVLGINNKEQYKDFIIDNLSNCCYSNIKLKYLDQSMLEYIIEYKYNEPATKDLFLIHIFTYITDETFRRICLKNINLDYGKEYLFDLVKNRKLVYSIVNAFIDKSLSIKSDYIEELYDQLSKSNLKKQGRLLLYSQDRENLLINLAEKVGMDDQDIIGLTLLGVNKPNEKWYNNVVSLLKTNNVVVNNINRINEDYKTTTKNVIPYKAYAIDIITEYMMIYKDNIDENFMNQVYEYAGEFEIVLDFVKDLWVLPTTELFEKYYDILDTPYNHCDKFNTNIPDVNMSKQLVARFIFVLRRIAYDPVKDVHFTMPYIYQVANTCLNHNDMGRIDLEHKLDMRWHFKMLMYFDTTNLGQKYFEICNVRHIKCLNYTLPDWYDGEQYYYLNEVWKMMSLDVPSLEDINESDKISELIQRNKKTIWLHFLNNLNLNTCTCCSTCRNKPKLDFSELSKLRFAKYTTSCKYCTNYNQKNLELFKKLSTELKIK